MGASLCLSAAPPPSPTSFPKLPSPPGSAPPAGAAGLSGGERLCKWRPRRRRRERRDLLDPGGDGLAAQEERRGAEPGHHGWILRSWASLPMSAVGHHISSGKKPHLHHTLKKKVCK